MASGHGNHTEFNQTQCEVSFKPTLFTVTVNTTSTTITVTPTDEDLTDRPVPPVDVAANAIHSINLMSRMSPSLYVSVLGESLKHNADYKQLQIGQPFDDVVTTSVEDFFVSMVDDILVDYGSSQIVISKNGYDVPVDGIVDAVRVGQAAYMYSVIASNAIIVLIFLQQALATRWWSALPRFDHSDLKSVIVAASARGTGMSAAAQKLHAAHSTSHSADADDASVGKIKVKLEARPQAQGGVLVALVTEKEVAGVRLTDFDSVDSKRLPLGGARGRTSKLDYTATTRPSLDLRSR